MPAISRDLLVVVAALAIVLAVAQAIASTWRRRARRRRILARVVRAGEGEAEAASSLVAAGYEILGAQVAADYAVHVDGEVTRASVRADYLVRRDDAVYVVEVKTGSVAPRIQTTATRRQLLEYSVAFDVDGVLLYDAEAGELHAVTFPRADARAPTRGSFGWGLVAGLVAAAAIALAIVSRSTP